MWLWTSLPEQQAMENFSSQLGEDVPLVAAFLGLLLGKIEVTPWKIHLMCYRVNYVFSHGIWAVQLTESLILCGSWR